ncbi:PAS domain S-box-containing protein [Mesonia phycicola]|uniref:histidine kinase n=1 Tax=Mesonia phycicola TaxID=579105 RepID=A0A1M6DTY0_9FLAO|nr:PAS domain S-box protein [Mesonia phycicola]SHI76704.1 PAS domain S-box-containing protein [Mesonia phycicola]
MKEPKLPKNESDRLKELESYKLIGLPEHDDYDFITEMAAQICGTKISLISLITEDKQWFLSHHGLKARETPKKYAFCAHAINQPSTPLIVEDAREDERFYDNPLTIDDPNVIFYAGVPLITDNGFALGTLCTIDNTPKTLSSKQLEQLKKLARQTVNLFENRKKSFDLDKLNKELKKKNELLLGTQETNQLGNWELDINTGETYWSDIVYDIHEVSRNYEHNKENAINFYHPDYRQPITDAVTNCITNNIPFDLICQLITGKGNLAWVRATGKKIEDKLIGSFQDITKIKHNEIRFKSVIEATNIGTWQWNIQTGEATLNNRWAEMLGYSLEELAPINIKTWEKLSHPEDLIIAKQKLEECFIKKTEYFNIECRMMHKNGKWIWVSDKGKVFEWTEEGKPLMMYGTHQDITERKEKEERIRISEEAFRGNFENAAIGMALLDKDGKWLKVNAKVCDIVGYSEDELMHLTFQDITHPDDLSLDLNLLQELVEGKREYYQMEKRYFHKQGYIVYILLAVSIVKNKAGEVLYFISQIIDISKSKKLLLDVNHQKDLLAALYKLSPIGIVLNDFETGKYIDINDKLLEPTGYSKEEFLNLTYWDITPPEYEPLEQIALKQLKENGKFELFEKEYIRKDGTRYPVALQGVLTEDSNNRKLIWAFVRDISKEKEAERKLKEAISSLQSILDASKQVSIISTDTKGNITLFNSGAEQLLGYKAKELIGKQIPETIHLSSEIEEQSNILSKEYNRKINGFESIIYEAKIGVPTTKEWTYLNKDRTNFPVLLSVNTILTHNDITGYLIVATDITKLKKVEKEITSLLDITNEQNERLRNFAHIVSHNLRSHSGGILAMLSLIQLEKPELTDNELFTLLNSGAENLRKTVEDLTEIVKINLTQINTSTIKLHEIIEKNIESLSIQIEETNFKIINNVDQNLTIKGLPAYIDSIVLNIITNSIKYRDQEKASYLKIFTTTDKDMITIYFEDNGLGIDLKKHGDKLFGMYKTFHHHDDSRGVGLFITKNQIESMGGKISLKSQVNTGTTFKVKLPK